jgi:hypothetical protein
MKDRFLVLFRSNSKQMFLTSIRLVLQIAYLRTRITYLQRCEISGSHDSEYEDDSVLIYSVV